MQMTPLERLFYEAIKAISVSGGGGGGTSDATAANQTAGNATLSAIDGHVDGLETLVAATNAALATIAGYVDGLETLIAATNTKLDTNHTDLVSVDGHVDGLEALIAATNTKLDTNHTDLVSVDGHVDGLETLVGATNTKLDTNHTDLVAIAGYVDGLEALITATNTKLDTNHTDLAKLDGTAAAQVTISLTSGTALSPAGSIAGKGITMLLMPAAWTTAVITFQVSFDNVTFYNLYDNAGVEYSLAGVTAGTAIILDPAVFNTIMYIKIRSGTNASPVVQAANRDYNLVTRPF